jgi:ketosteroid isomerase-like protein
MITKDRAWKFAQEWITAWNAHDIDGVLDHYTDDFEMTSPLIARGGMDAGARLRGREQVGAYWRATLQRYPGLKLELVDVLYGHNSVILYYRSILNRKVAQVFHFGPGGKVFKAAAHYDSV